jgi:L-alanine-DL-glutamate epimerase-like enolase superfamily enzyme
MDEVRHLVVRVALSDGSMGVAEAPPRPTIYGETPASMVAILRDEVGPRVVGGQARDALRRMSEIPYNYAAKGALDIAIHDAVAQSQGITLAQHLGSRDIGLRVSYILGIGKRDEILAEAQGVVERGVRVLKVKVGREWRADLLLVGELRELLGPSVDLYADANECMDSEEAGNILAALREQGLLYCEEPLPVELVRERAALRAKAILPMIADDSAFSARDLRRELALNTFDILNIKTARTGYSESLGMLGAATAAGKGVMVGSQASAGLGAARAALFAGLPGIEYPSELTFFLKLREDIVAEPLSIRDGRIQVSDAVNVRIDADRLRDAAVAAL